MNVDGDHGTGFAVWAPNAERVSVIADFNAWDGDAHQLAPVGDSGIWDGFVPGVAPGACYKYRIRARGGGYQVDKADPFALATEVPPRTASVIADLSYEWNDAEWMAMRGARNALNAPIAIYELHAEGAKVIEIQQLLGPTRAVEERARNMSRSCRAPMALSPWA